MEVLSDGPQRALLVVNPASRGGRRKMPRARDAFQRAGVECDVFWTEAPGHGGEIVHELHEEYDAIFSLGGDGTAMEIVGALAGTGRSVGLLAGGTGNLLVRALGIPLDVRRAVPRLLAGTRTRIDLGALADGRRFAVAAGAGIDAAMVAGAPPAMRRRLGVLAYFVSATRAIWRPTRFRVRATVDGTTVEHDAALVMVANVGTILDGLFHLGPGIRHDDGAIDLCIFDAADFGAAAGVFTRLARRDFRPDGRMLFLRGREITVATDPPVLMQADGELLGDTPLVVRVDPRAASLLVPRR